MAIAIERSLPSGLDAFTRHLEDPSLTHDERARILRIAENLTRSNDEHNLHFGPRASMQTWEETLYRITATTTISGTTTETIMVPDYPLPAGYLTAGRYLKYTLLGDYSTAITTPGTLTFRLRYGGVAGTVLAVSGAFAPDPTAASTTVPFIVEWFIACRADGASGSLFVQGRMMLSDYDDASATTVVGNLNMQFVPVSAPAAVTVNTTTANALSPTSAASVTTGSLRTNMAMLEVLN